MNKNYRVNEKTVSIYGKLTEQEEAIVLLAIKAGKTPVYAEKKKTVRVKYSDIVDYFTKTEANEELIEKLEKYKTDNGKKTVAATDMHVLKWFRDEYKEEYEKVYAYIKGQKK